MSIALNPLVQPEKQLYHAEYNFSVAWEFSCEVWRWLLSQEDMTTAWDTAVWDYFFALDYTCDSNDVQNWKVCCLITLTVELSDFTSLLKKQFWLEGQLRLIWLQGCCLLYIYSLYLCKHQISILKIIGCLSRSTEFAFRSWIFKNCVFSDNTQFSALLSFLTQKNYHALLILLF